MTEDELKQIEARCNAATPGPWHTCDPIWRQANSPGWVLAGDYDPHRGAGVVSALEIMEWEDGEDPCYTQSDVDLDFIANARTDIPALIAEVRRLQLENERLIVLTSANDDLAQAVRNMPPNSSLSMRPLNDNLGGFAWEFERPGEPTTAAETPLLALTFHKMPLSDPS